MLLHFGLLIIGGNFEQVQGFNPQNAKWLRSAYSDIAWYEAPP